MNITVMIILGDILVKKDCSPLVSQFDMDEFVHYIWLVLYV